MSVSLVLGLKPVLLTYFLVYRKSLAELGSDWRTAWEMDLAAERAK